MAGGWSWIGDFFVSLELRVSGEFRVESRELTPPACGHPLKRGISLFVLSYYRANDGALNGFLSNFAV